MKPCLADATVIKRENFTRSALESQADLCYNDSQTLVIQWINRARRA